MTKEQFIEMVQGLLASGDLQSDIRGRYNYNQIAAVTNQVVSEIFAQDPLVADQMSVKYDFYIEPDSNNVYGGQLPVLPLNGSQGIRIMLANGQTLYGTKSITDEILNNILKGISSPIWSYREGRIFFNRKSQYWEGKQIVTAFVVPDILDMDDTQPFILDKYSDFVSQKVCQTIKAYDTRPEEKVNDTSQDAS
jgi:hypothetical protein